MGEIKWPEVFREHLMEEVTLEETKGFGYCYLFIEHLLTHEEKEEGHFRKEGDVIRNPKERILVPVAAVTNYHIFVGFKGERSCRRKVQS